MSNRTTGWRAASGCTVWTASRRQLLAMAALGTFPLRVQAAPAEGLTAPNQKLAMYGREQKLLHARLAFDGVARVEPLSGRIVETRLHSGGRPMLVHLWSVNCPPCVRELPALRQVMAHLRMETGLRVVFISEDLPSALTSFLKAHGAGLPEVEHWLSGPSSGLRIDLHDSGQPMTLLIDANLVVRQAFVGLVSERRNELFAGASRLLRSLTAHPHARAS